MGGLVQAQSYPFQLYFSSVHQPLGDTLQWHCMCRGWLADASRKASPALSAPSLQKNSQKVHLTNVPH